INKTNTRKHIGITVSFLIVLVVFIAGIKMLQIRALSKSGQSNGPPPIAVATQLVQTVEWIDQIQATGTIVPIQGTLLSTQLPGTVESINFESGQDIEVGDILLRLDCRQERAELASANANAELAQINYARAQKLLASNTISQAEFDLSAAETKKATALVEQIKSRIEQKSIRAPFTGSLGIRQIQEGQYLRAGEPVVSLQAVESVYVNFYLSQSAYAYLKEGLAVSVSSDVLGDSVITGKISAVANEVDVSSRMIEVQATLPNSERRLASGMYVNVLLSLTQKREALVIPQTAIVYSSYGNSVYLSKLDEDGTIYRAKQVAVTLGKRRGDYVEVLSGVTEGSSVVTDGVFKIYPGAVLLLEDARAPTSELAPELNES
ncbi:MAG: efflux RND transporter periplasmic adaptor subunit, partial [Verrucomicrobiota bacterium]|nr:efflux RND transporter periplasmic adaptor subunit [Verrucomicrobiota bacterium]